MPTQAEMKAVMQKYIDGFNNKDWEAIASLYADNARIEDPVGKSTYEGRKAINALYKKGVEMVKKIELVGPISGSYSNVGAMPFTLHMHWEGKKVKVNVIDIMTFDEKGKIIDMKAYWGSEDIIEEKNND